MSGHAYHFHIKKKDQKRLINRVCTIFSVILPLTALPQVHMLYTTKNTTGLSLAMWVMYAIGCIPFLLFGHIYNHKQLIVLNSLWLIMQAVMIAGIIVYS